ncbi:MAG: DUF4097 family beta strand repeat-containing protein [Pyrinomonadaceae bacterium]
MSWLISVILASSLFTSGNIPISDKYVNENQNSQNINTLDETERLDQTYPLNPNGKVSVSNVNGSITIEAWDRSEVKLEAIKTADSQETLNQVKIEVDARPDRISIETDYGNWNRRGDQKWDNYKRRIEVQYRLNVPRTAVLDEIETVNGSVSLKNLGNYTKASSVNGAVTGMNLRGTAELSTVNGGVTGDFDQLPTGSIISLSTVNGSANLVIPSDVNATVRAETVNGSIKNDFGLPVRKGKYVGADLYGKIGTGDVKVKLESVNGGLSVQRKSDGKSPNPVLNLLPPKKDDDDDFNDDFDNDFEITMKESRRMMERNLERTRRVMEKAIITSNKEALESLKAGNVANEAMVAEINRIEPQIARINAEALRDATAAIELADSKASIAAIAESKETMARLAEYRLLSSPYMEERNGSYRIKGVPTVHVETVNCSVSIRGWDKPEVKYAVSKVASGNFHFPVEFKAEQTDEGEVQLKAVNKNEWAFSRAAKSEPALVRLEVFVPKKSNLKIVTNDEVRLEGVSGEIDLQGQNGAINVRDSDGELNLKAEDSLIRIIGFKGKLESDTGDGDLFLEGDFQQICAQAKDGTIVLTLPKETNASVHANTDSVAGEGIDLIREETDSEESSNLWRIGDGGREFNFNMAEGKVIIRSLSELKNS